ncbi:winged helix-turn-helix domain-containing protein [Brachybacterium nesterenkovii]|uniref:Winged helix-turn-helix domain-containing protein n=1 Tax=Brachybacterium nesterenkovii TaxID=47847 RepID=A0A1X6WY95_9MICO|nr:crosslink repair DNA glycosylase YcaQ family protein [Brachybacterium nesterenkovii]SLM90728.1 hypothetical protein FM110_05410 [Brachybacterium nesterenkovii]
MNARPPARLTAVQARRIALRAQGMGRSRRTEVPDRRTSREALRRTVERTQLLQIDSVSVFARAHLMPVFTRAGSWDTTVLDAASRPGRSSLLTEALAHEAAYVPPDVHALLAFRRERAARKDWGAVRRAGQSDPRVLEDVLDTVARRAPISAAGVSRVRGDAARSEEGWGWRRTDTQWIVEYLFRSGRLACVGRSPQFERLYDLAPDASAPLVARAPDAGTGVPDDGAGADGLVDGPAETHAGDLAARTEDPAAVRELVLRAALACGVATEADLADYFRLPRREVAPAIAELRGDGLLEDVVVALPAGELPMLRHVDAPSDAPVRAAALVSPFDPIAFYRPRLAALYGVDYRIGIYTPRHRRTHGYYPLPFLLGDRIEARVDLRADRRRGVLEVCEAHREARPAPGVRRRTDVAVVAEALAGELERARVWQGLESIEVLGRGDLAAELGRALA